MTSLLKKLSIYQNWCKSGSRREVVANYVHTADADATKQFRRVGVGGVYWASGNEYVLYSHTEN